MKLDQPYNIDPKLECDPALAVEGISRLGPDVGAHRSNVMDVMHRVKRWFAPLEKVALAARPGHQIGATSPTFVDFFTALFSSSDHGLAHKLVEGFEISGDFEECHVHREITSKIKDGAAARAESLGEAAASFINILENETPLVQTPPSSRPRLRRRSTTAWLE